MGGVTPTCNTHLTSVKPGTEMMVWSNLNALYTFLGRYFHSTTFDPELKNERFILISFIEVSYNIKYITAISSLHLQ